MTLFRKSLLFVVGILSIQMILISGLLLLLTAAEKRAERLAYSRAAIYGASKMVPAFTEALHLVGLVAIYGDTNVKKRYENLRQEISDTLHRLSKDKYASAQDLKDLDRLESEAEFLFHELKEFEQNLVSCTSPEGFILETATFKSSIFPYLNRVTEMANAFARRHLLVERRLQQTNSSYFVSGFGMLFLVNVLVTAAYVIAFNRLVVKRLAVVTQNFVRFANNSPLYPKQQGADEIAFVDHEFHALSRLIVEASEKDQSLFNNMPVGLITCDEEGRIQKLNPLALKWLGEATINCLLEQVVEDRQKLAAVLSGEVSGSVRARIRMQDRDMVLTELSASRFHYQSKAYVIIALVDLSDREENEKMRQEFLNIVSHDIRTPIAAVCMLVEMIQEDSDEIRKLKYCGSAKTQLDNIMKLANNLLDVARMEAGSITLDRQECSVGALIEQATEVVTFQAKKAGVRIIERSTDLFVDCDPDRIQQVLVNFLSNALKYSGSDTTIEIYGEQIEQIVRIAVRDQGRGIPASEISTVFDRFKQVREQDAKRGAGLGLTICKLLVESHGGQVGVTSVDGEGSTFWLDLPVNSIALE